ncbi:hypothetical protein EDEG_01657 [Edhazardia aedis USNM 41457]|uniref:SAM-dependent methyltransferase TRM5/TYW2-type domain-containing protein n=1 Tax=Edhazardia aedis (strain USNM 41457) TaxID=1003232 RepID=J9D8L3_EDHAE|nr:hypothetical protein EDEG_01657 [Edhazardia aedis USNM 41457]|eukprot:EJW04081.1 hypothetical protein EDEG_01657 [Edhazardia aedis USNM 41457]
MTNIKELQKKITAKFVPVNKKHIKDCIKKYESYFLKYERLPHMLSLSKKYDQFEFCMKDIPNGTDTIILIDKNVNMKDENEMGEITITLNYKYFNSSEIFDMLKIPNVGSFQMIGHIIHLNLIPEQYEYKKIYGEVFLMKNKNIKSVIYKTNSVHGIYRTFQFEVIAGIDDLKTVHTENNINYYIDYEKVYWNSKLSAERMKLVTKCFKKGDIIADCTCGAGPLALLAAKMDFKVFANDLNPHAIECIKKSIKKNKKLIVTILCCII